MVLKHLNFVEWNASEPALSKKGFSQFCRTDEKPLSLLSSMLTKY